MANTFSDLFESRDRTAPPAPVERSDPAVGAAAQARKRAAALAMGQGKTRLTSGLGDTATESRKPTLLGEVRT